MEGELVQDPVLSSIGLVFNARAGVMTCTGCRIAIRQAHARSHVATHKDAHFKFPPQAEFDRACRRLGVRADFPSIGDSMPIQFEGLPVHDVHRCAHCIHNVLLSGRSMHQHYSDKHRGHACVIANLQTCQAQRWSNGGEGSDNVYFEVKPVVSEPSAEEASINAVLEQSAGAFSVKFGLASDRHQTQWEAATGWPQWTTSVGYDTLRLRVETPKDDDLLFPLVADVREYLHNGGQLAYATVDVIRRRFVSPKPEL